MFDILSDPIGMLTNKLLPEPKYIKEALPKDTPEAIMSTLPFDMLLKMRDEYKDDPIFQKKIAPYEHKAFAKMLVEHNPAFWTPTLAIMTPSYQAYKSAKKDYEIEKDATPPSMKQIMEGYKGIYEGLKTKVGNLAYKDPFGDTIK